MSSKFAQGTMPAKLPPWCIKPRPDLPTGFVNGTPTGLTAVAYWTDTPNDIAIAESFRLYYDAALPGWIGQSGRYRLNLKLSVLILPAPDTYDFLLELRQDLTPIDDDSWHDVTIQTPPPWNSGVLQHIYDPGTDHNGIHVLD